MDSMFNQNLSASVKKLKLGYGWVLKQDNDQKHLDTSQIYRIFFYWTQNPASVMAILLP